MNHSQIPRPKQDINSPPTSYKSPYVSQSSLLDSPIAQLLGFGSSSSQNINLPQIPNINNNSNNTNANENIPLNNISFNTPPTFTETKEGNNDKSDETKNLNIRLHNFQPPPLLLPNQNLLQPQFIESPRTTNQDEFLEDFEFYPEESPNLSFANNSNSSSTNSSFIYSNLNSSPSPRTSTFDRSHATFDIVNKSQSYSDVNENSSINRFSTSPTFAKNGVNRNSNKSIINLNLLNSPKLKPYMSNTFITQNTTTGANSTFSNKEDIKSDTNDTKYSILSDIPSPKTPTFDLSNIIEDNNYNKNNNEVSIAAQNFEGSKSNSSIFNSNNTFLIDDISNPRNNNKNDNNGLPPIFTNASRSMLRIENDISTLRNTLNEVHEKYKRKYKSEKEKCSKEIIAMIERHREELDNFDESKNDHFFSNHPILPSSKPNSRNKNRFRNSNRRIRHDESDDQTLFSKKQLMKQSKHSTFNVDSIRFGHDSNKVIKCIGSSPPSSSLSNGENVFTLPSTLKVSRTSGQPTIHQQNQPESVIRVRVRIPNKKELSDPKRMSLIQRQREEIIALNEETSLRLSSIIEEGLNAEKQINDRIADLSASKNGSNHQNFAAVSDASSSSSSAPSAFCIDESDGSTKDELSVMPTVTSKYSSSSSSLSSSSFSSTSNLNANHDQRNVNHFDKQKTNKQNMIPACGKTRNTPQRLLRNIPH